MTCFHYYWCRRLFNESIKQIGNGEAAARALLAVDFFFEWVNPVKRLRGLTNIHKIYESNRNYRLKAEVKPSTLGLASAKF
jgi:hypothetical protein